MIKKVILIAGIITALCVTILFQSWFTYWLEQTQGQFKVLYDSISVEEALNDVSLSDQSKRNLQLLPKLKAYANDSLGLNILDNYNRVYLQYNRPTLWSLSASESYKLQAFQWSYPIVGEVGYRGFFNHDRGKEEAAALARLGLDTSLSEVSAWSTLGWFNDPILSNNLELNTGEFARLILHESTHATIYIKSDDVFNENLATYIGNQGALQFLAIFFGKNSIEYKELQDRLEDIALYEAFMAKSTVELKQLYDSAVNLDLESKDSLKKMKMEQLAGELKRIAFNDSSRYANYADRWPQWNNAHFTGFLQYYSQQDSIHTVVKSRFAGNLKSYLTSLK